MTGLLSNLRRWAHLVGVAVMLGGSGTAFGAAAPPRERPNIGFIMADNMGWGGVYGGGALRGAPTPRIDALATQGTRRQTYDAEVSSAPSRAARMTGRVRTGNNRSGETG